MKYGEQRRPLGERPIGGQGSESEPAAPDPDGKPCWIELNGQRIPGIVHGWHRTEAGWTAVVLTWLPASAVRPRD